MKLILIRHGRPVESDATRPAQALERGVRVLDRGEIVLA
jgi:hypothetical protein